MENLILSFNVVLPLLISIVLGYVLRLVGILTEPVRRGLNALSFRVFLPIYLFSNIYTTRLSAAFNGKLITFALVGLIVLFAVLMGFIPLIEKENPKRGVMVQGIFRSNIALFGLPIAATLCGEENMGATSLLVGIVVPLYNVLAVIALETFRGGKPSLVQMLKRMATNLLIIGSVLGVVMNVLHVPMADGLQKAVTDLGRVATPLSLVALGGEFKFSKIRACLRQLLIVLAGKLVVVPIVMVALGIWLGFRSETLVPILAMYASPIAVSSFTMAQQMEGDGQLAASLVVFTTSASIVTIFLFVFVLKQLAFI